MRHGTCEAPTQGVVHAHMSSGSNLSAHLGVIVSSLFLGGACSAFRGLG